MNDDEQYAGNVVLLRGACLWLLTALFLAWCLVGMGLGVPAVTAVFKDFTRLLQAHIDLLLMTALIFGIYAAKVPYIVSRALVHGRRRIYEFQFVLVDVHLPGDAGRKGRRFCTRRFVSHVFSSVFVYEPLHYNLRFWYGIDHYFSVDVCDG